MLQKIKELEPSIDAVFVPVELDKTASVRAAADIINDQVEKIDVLINNAGIMASEAFQTNDAGIETQLATNHVGHFLLTKLLIDKVYVAGAGARIVNVASDGYLISPFRFDDWNFSNGKEYDPWSSYGQSKTANILFTRQLAAKLAKRGILAFAVHPGVIMDTSLGKNVRPDSFNDISDIAMRNTGEPFTVGNPKSLQQGVATILMAALDPSIANEPGSYLEDCHPVPLRPYASSSENVEKLWQLSEQLTGESFDLG